MRPRSALLYQSAQIRVLYPRRSVSRFFSGSVAKGSTDGSGNITTWNVDHQYGSTASPKVTSATIEARLRSQGPGPNQNMPFTIVEVDYKYKPLLSTLMPRSANLPMTSYAIVQQY